ncbi:MAG: FAD:protein FMN transferase [Sinobacteraceae bacterium]|nr:FAD:protein FMN transferase [Nevskiaceae bacterium]
MQRAQPWLGTLVRIAVQGSIPAAAHAAIERLCGDRRPPRTDELPRRRQRAEPPGTARPRRARSRRTTGSRSAAPRAGQAVEASDGVFDPTIAPRLVEWGLPALAPHSVPDPQANWRDIELDDDRVRFRRALWIGLAARQRRRGDAALAAMVLPAEAQVCIDAGGDLRLPGPRPQRVVLERIGPAGRALPVLELTDGAVASSTGLPACRRHAFALDRSAPARAIPASGGCDFASVLQFAVRPPTH